MHGGEWSALLVHPSAQRFHWPVLACDGWDRKLTSEPQIGPNSTGSMWMQAIARIDARSQQWLAAWNNHQRRVLGPSCGDFRGASSICSLEHGTEWHAEEEHSSERRNDAGAESWISGGEEGHER